MAFVHGKDTVFSLDDTSGSLQDISAYLNSVDFPESNDVNETTAFGQGSKSYVVGLFDATISCSGMWDSTLDGYITAASEPYSRTFEYGPQGSGAGAIKYTGECIVTGYSVSNPVGDVVTFSLDMQVTAGVTRTTY